jgi:hypothetical protein
MTEHPDTLAMRRADAVRRVVVVQRRGHGGNPPTALRIVAVSP